MQYAGCADADEVGLIFNKNILRKHNITQFTQFTQLIQLNESELLLFLPKLGPIPIHLYLRISL